MITSPPAFTYSLCFSQKPKTRREKHLRYVLHIRLIVLAVATYTHLQAEVSIICLFLTSKLVYDLNSLVQRTHLTIEDIEEYS